MERKEEQKKPLQDMTEELANEASGDNNSAEESKEKRAKAEREIAEKR